MNKLKMAGMVLIALPAIAFAQPCTASQAPSQEFPGLDMSAIQRLLAQSQRLNETLRAQYVITVMEQRDKRLARALADARIHNKITLTYYTDSPRNKNVPVSRTYTVLKIFQSEDKGLLDVCYANDKSRPDAVNRHALCFGFNISDPNSFTITQKEQPESLNIKDSTIRFYETVLGLGVFFQTQSDHMAARMAWTPGSSTIELNP